MVWCGGRVFFSAQQKSFVGVFSMTTTTMMMTTKMMTNLV